MLWINPPAAGRWLGAPRAAGAPPDEPYFAWANHTSFSAFTGAAAGAPAWVPVIIEVDPAITTVAAAAANLLAAGRIRNVPALYLAAAAAVPPTLLDVVRAKARFFTAEANTLFFIDMANRAAPVAGILRGEFAQAIKSPLQPPIRAGIDATGIAAIPVPAPAPQSQSQAAPLPDVVVGLVDDGLPFANARYLTPTGAPRVWSLWHQGAASIGLRAGAVPYGYELDRAEINGALAAARRGGVIDEELLYQGIGYLRNCRRETHGAAVMDLLCGEPNPGTANIPAIVGVQLPPETVADTSGLALPVNVLDGVRHIIDRALGVINPDAKVVINLSLGEIAGPHDGSSMLERALDDLISIMGPKLQVYYAAGNHYLSRAHAQFEITNGAPVTLDWRILPDDETPSFLEIWLPAGIDAGARGVTVAVTPPGAAASPAVTFATSQHLVSGAGANDVLCRIDFTRQPGVAPAAARDMILIAVAATQGAGAPTAPFGTWTIALQQTGAQATPAEAWIQRDDTPFGYGRHGRQSYFDDRRDQRFDALGRLCEQDVVAAPPPPVSYVRRTGTLNALACKSAVGAPQAWAVGGYRRSDGWVPNYVSAGQTAGQPIPSPNLMAPCEDSLTLHGVLAGGTHSNSMMALNGTSAASPQAARLGAAGQLAAAVAAAAIPVNLMEHDAGGNLVGARPVRGATPIFTNQRNVMGR